MSEIKIVNLDMERILSCINSEEFEDAVKDTITSIAGDGSKIAPVDKMPEGKPFYNLDLLK